MIEAGQGLAGRQGETGGVVVAHCGVEQQREQIDHASGLIQARTQAIQCATGIRLQLLDPHMQATERFVVRRQYQYLIRHATTQRGQGFKPVVHRVGIRLARLHRDIGRDAWQHLVAGNQQLAVCVVQAGMFR
ncbi:hypothetical protein D3C76_1265600 [compost metagenome]